MNHYITAPPVRIGAVSYLNARPLVETLVAGDPGLDIIFDHPSRLADALAAGRLDVAMIPSIEYARQPGCTIISDACIACDGAVRSVKLYGRTAVERIRTLALDEGSRTSAALSLILLKERFGIAPDTCRLPIGAPIDSVDADAVLMIGDRGIGMAGGRFEFVWDLGEEWSSWTGLPFVFALWIARPGAELPGVSAALSRARDAGLGCLEQIARREASKVGLSERDCLSYLRDNLKFHFGPRQQEALRRYYDLAGRHGLAPADVRLVFHANAGFHESVG